MSETPDIADLLGDDAAASPVVRTLSERHRLFAIEYLKDLNAYQAAIRAGYSDPSHAVSRILADERVQALIGEEIARRRERVRVEADDVLREIMRVAFFDLGAIYNDDGTLKRVADMPLDARRALAGVESFEVFTKGAEPTKLGDTRKVKILDKLKALELLGRHLALFNDKLDLNVNVDLSKRIVEARKRASV